MKIPVQTPAKNRAETTNLERGFTDYRKALDSAEARTYLADKGYNPDKVRTDFEGFSLALDSEEERPTLIRMERLFRTSRRMFENPEKRKSEDEPAPNERMAFSVVQTIYKQR